MFKKDVAKKTAGILFCVAMLLSAATMNQWTNMAHLTANAEEDWSYISSFEIYEMPTKTVYKVGDKLDYTGLILKANLADGSGWLQFTNFDEAVFSPTVFNGAGKQTVTVTIGDKSTSFEVEVTEDVKITSYEVMEKPKKTTYSIGETLDYTGLVLKANRSDGKWDRVESFRNAVFTPNKFNSAGTQKVTVTINGMSTSFNVTVASNIQAYEILEMPKKIEYKAGEKPDGTGLVLKEIYSNGEWKEFSDVSKMTFAPAVLDVPGEQTVTVSVGEFKVEFKVTVGWYQDDVNHWIQYGDGSKKSSAPHEVNDWELKKAVTKQEAGERSGSCVICGYEVTEEVTESNHEHEFKGEGKRTCTVCGMVEDEDPVTIEYVKNEGGGLISGWKKVVLSIVGIGCVFGGCFLAYRAFARKDEE